MSRTADRVDYVLNESVLVHAVQSAGIAELNQIQLLILRALRDAVVHKDDLFAERKGPYCKGIVKANG